MQKLAEIVHASATEVRKAVGELRDMKNMRLITESLIRINSLENQADDMFDMSIERLFATEPDAKEVIKKREIYQSMEMATDICEDDEGIPNHQVSKFQEIAAIKPAKITTNPICPDTTSGLTVLATVSATP